ncbi:MAG: IS110 family transposase [Pirellula sp.]
MKSYKRVIGIDISTERLDIADSNTKIAQEVDYSIDAIKSKILKLIKKPFETLVVCEATGGLEYNLVDMLHDAKIDVVVANPARIRDFAKGHGFLEKSDKIDARVLQLYGQQVTVSLAKPRTPQERNFIALTRRRTQLLQLISQESNRLRQSNDPQVIAFLEEMLKSLKTQMKSVDSCIEKALEEQAKTNPSIDIIRSVPGVGVVMTATLVAELPELGTISRTKIAKLVGVAPMIKQSGKSDERRRARGGRGGVRRVLYMATLAATQKNDLIKKRYIKLVASRKSKKVALVACMRTLLTILNDMVRHQTKWGEEKKSVAGKVVCNRPAPAHVLDKS